MGATALVSQPALFDRGGSSVGKRDVAKPSGGQLENRFDPTFVTRLALREKQIQQNYRPVIGIHKWFARRPGSVFRSLLLAEFGNGDLADAYWQPHHLSGTIADPFMGGGTPLFEANRLGFDVVGCDVNPMAWWIVRQSVSPLEPALLRTEGQRIASMVEKQIGDLYRTRCLECGHDAPVKYFLWVKTAVCPECSLVNDLFPGYRLAALGRHPYHVVACAACGELGEFSDIPTRDAPGACASCAAEISVEGRASRGSTSCTRCDTEISYPQAQLGPPDHRLWAIEYNCPDCYPKRKGRQFKTPDDADMNRVEFAASRLAAIETRLPLPNDDIPGGDETDRLHRWGYRRYREMFSERQLLGLGLLLEAICTETVGPVRDAMLTVFSDSLRYQNMLCRYATDALKCQDIFSVHGFPVGLIQCENNVLGIPGVGAGGFRHFVEKFVTAKEYCAAPFEVRRQGSRNLRVPVEGETISADLSDECRVGKSARLHCGPSQTTRLAAESLDGVFTDPPYFDNVQYAELMDFCYVWLRRVLACDHPEFAADSTRAVGELTGNGAAGRGLASFTDGLSAVFCNYAAALKHGAPFVFTYHHNDPQAYVPLVVALLDAELTCTAVLPAAAEMAASLHIAHTSSSVLDSVFVCRAHQDRSLPLRHAGTIPDALRSDIKAMAEADVRLRPGDVRCLLAGHVAARAIRALIASWNRADALERRMELASAHLADIRQTLDSDSLVEELVASTAR